MLGESGETDSFCAGGAWAVSEAKGVPALGAEKVLEQKKR